MLPIVKLLTVAAARRFVTRLSRNEKSQAVSELAILGALVLLGLGVIISYGQSMNSQQSLQMKAFRRALAESRNRKQVVSYTIVRDSPGIDVKDFVGRPDTSRQVASNTLCAMKEDLGFDPEDKTKRGSCEIYEINGQKYEIEPIKVKVYYEDGDYTAWVSAPISDVEYNTQKQRTGSLNKSENKSSISTTLSGSVTAQDITYLVLQDEETFKQQYLKDLRDGMEDDQWEKVREIDISSFSYEMAEFLASLIAIGVIEYFGLAELAGCGPLSIVENAILSAATIGINLLLSELLDKEPGEGEPVSVEILEGYRQRDSLSGTISFSPAQPPFEVSH